MAFIERGVHVLVEKPMARTRGGGRRLVDAAAARGVTLAVGPHRALQSRRASPPGRALHEPRFIEVHRLGTFPERSLDIDVVFDLMIHDLDVVLSIVGEPSGEHRGGGRAGADAARRHRQRPPAIRRRLHRQPHRQPDQPRPRPEDPVLPARRLPVGRLRGPGESSTGRWRPPESGSARPSIQGGKLDVAKDEPLRRELDDFVAAVRDGRAAGRDRRAGPRRPARWRRCIVERDGAWSAMKPLDGAGRAGELRADRRQRLDPAAETLRALAGTTDVLALGALADDAAAGPSRPGRDLRPGPRPATLADIDAWTAPPPAATEVRLVGRPRVARRGRDGGAAGRARWPAAWRCAASGSAISAALGAADVFRCAARGRARRGGVGGARPGRARRRATSARRPESSVRVIAAARPAGDRAGLAARRPPARPGGGRHHRRGAAAATGRASLADHRLRRRPHGGAGAAAARRRCRRCRWTGGATGPSWRRWR